MAEINNVKVLVDYEDMQAIANAIRTRTNSTEGITIAEMPTQIGGITGGEDVTAETATYTNELAELQTKITALETALDGKASGGSGENNFETEIINGTLTTYENSKATKLRTYAFASYSSLTSVNFPACTEIGYSAFQVCRSLTSVSFPACTTIKGEVFYDCSNLTSVNFPACTEIGYSAFQACRSLTSVSFPVCTTIGYSAFKDCSSLTAIYLMNASMCLLANSNAFTATKITSTTGSIFVPTSLVTSYKNATNWTYFSNVIYPHGNSEGSGSEDGGSESTITFYVENVAYTAAPNMTWAEWVDSKYNTSGFIIDGEDLIITNNHCTLYNDVDGSYITLPTDIIIENGAYYEW